MFKSNNAYLRLIKPIFYLVTLAVLQACGGGSDGDSGNNTDQNSSPSISNLSINDANGGDAISGDTLTLDYVYADAEGDLEGASQVRWLRNGEVINSAASTSYMLDDIDTATEISVEVIPVAATGTLEGNAVVSAAITVIDNVQPAATIAFPPANSVTELGLGGSITVRGFAADTGGILSVTVNGIDAISADGFANWTAEVSPLLAGSNTLTATITDNHQNITTKSVEIRRAPLATGISELTQDKANDRFLALENNQLIEISQTTGLTAALPSLNNLNLLDRVADTELDSANNRMIVIDNQDDLSTIKEINMTSGERTIISQDLLSQPEGTLSRLIYDMAVDTVGNRLFVADGINGIIEIDLLTGNRSLVSPTVTKAIVWDGPNDRVIAATHTSVIVVNVTTGAGSTLASSIGVSGPQGIAYDSANNRVFISARNSDHIIVVKLIDGTRSTVTDNTYTGCANLNSPLYMEYDAANERLLITDTILTGINVNTGECTALASPAGELDGISFDSTNNLVYTVKRGSSLLEFDLGAADTSRVISDNTVATSTSNTDFGDIWGLEINYVAGVAYISDWSSDSIIEVDLLTGERITLADNSQPDADNTFITPTAFSYDAVGNRLLILDSGRRSLIEFNYGDGSRRVISSPTVPDSDNAFRGPVDIRLDLANNRVFVLDNQLASIVAVDLTTGARTIQASISGIFSHNDFNFDLDLTGNRFLLANRFNGLTEVSMAGVSTKILDRDFYDVVFDPDTSHAFVLESEIPSRSFEIVDIDLSTGKDVLVPVGVTPNNNVVLDDPFDIAIDDSGNRAFVTDMDRAAVIAIDLDTGARSIFADNAKAIAESNVDFTRPKGIVFDKQSGRLLVLDSKRLIAVALSNGARTLISDNTIVSVVDFVFVDYMAADLPNNRALVVDRSLKALIAVDLTTGVRTVLSDNTIAVAESTIDFAEVSDIAIDHQNNRALMTDRTKDAIIEIDLNTGARSVFSDNSSLGGDSHTYTGIHGILVDSGNSRAIVIDDFYRTIIAADLDDGARFTIPGTNGPNAFYTFGTSSIELDTRYNRAFAVDEDRDAIIAIDLATGQKVIFSK